jgi:tetratricopeptide (TPR) repeat protein
MSVTGWTCRKNDRAILQNHNNCVHSKGLLEEEVNRDLEAAIRAYEAAVTWFDDQRNAAATAVFRLAECHRKLGRTDPAIALYRRVLTEFPDHTTLVDLSRTHLARLDVQTEAVPAIPEGLDPDGSRIPPDDAAEQARMPTMREPGRILLLASALILCPFLLTTADVVNRPRRSYGLGDLQAIALSPDGSWLASAGQSGAFLWDLSVGEVRHRLENHGVPVTAIAWRMNSRWHGLNLTTGLRQPAFHHERRLAKNRAIQWDWKP